MCIVYPSIFLAISFSNTVPTPPHVKEKRKIEILIILFQQGCSPPLFFGPWIFNKLTFLYLQNALVLGPNILFYS